MSGDWDEDLCKKALVLVEELCFNSPRDYSQSERCQEFSYLLRGRNRQLDSGEAPSAPTGHAGRRFKPHPSAARRAGSARESRWLLHVRGGKP
ncbi:unnamed protein product [Tetraodon nigroviridis]|uniref:(spotted green pufferfish) hypothetical protein n=1 Tax=Tetraodon nigroviridis TaxID=99883 RepID=Q4SW06_TETNG|nr:unnamed protein product [Tetraodon nigroviridis]